MSSAGMAGPAGVTRAIAEGVPSAVKPVNPFGLLESYANVQNALNKNLEFQREYAAKQQAGEIIASSKDLPTAIQQMEKNPSIAGYIPQILNSYQGLEQLTAQTRGVQQGNAQSALGQLLKAVPAAATDPASFDKTMNTYFQTVPPQLRKQFAPIRDGIKSALFDDLPTDKKAASAEVLRRWNAMMLPTFSPAQIAQQTGVATTVSTPQGTIPAVQLPGVFGGGLQRAPGAVVNLPAPQFLQTPSGGFVQAGGLLGPSTTAETPRGANALGIAPAASPTSTLLAGEAPLPSIVAAPLPQLTAGAWSAGEAAAARQPPVAKGVAGIPIMSKANTEQSVAMAHDFATKGTTEFNQAQQSLFYLQQMDNDLDTLAKNGGLLTPGFKAKSRVELGTALNTISQAFGGKPLVSPEKLASAESSNKITATMAAGLVNSFFGTQNVAYGTLERGIESVPGIENSYLGGKLLTEGLRAVAKRAIAQHVFQQAWLQRRGTLAGSDIAFNAQFPPGQLAEQVLGKFGMTEQGFASPEALAAAYRQGYISKDTAAKIYKKEFAGKAQAPGGMSGGK